MRAQPIVLNAAGKPIKLTPREQRLAEYLENHIQNSLGYEVSITTLTALSKKITEQKYYQLSGGAGPADYIPIVASNGAWGTQITTYRSFIEGDDFSTGVVATGSGNSRLAGVDASVDSVSVKIRNWAKSCGWTLFDVEQASRSGNWDVIATLQKARKKNFDLGIQAICFLGMSGDSSVLGLYNQSGITTDTTNLPMPFWKMTPADLAQAPGNILESYRSNNNRTAYPNRFVWPESDYNRSANQASPTFPIKSIKQVLEDTFKEITGHKDFKILPSAYGDQAYGGLASVCTYALYNYEEESIRMDLPVPYSATLANSTDNFNFTNVGYAQFTGVQVYRPLELLYFTNAG